MRAYTIVGECVEGGGSATDHLFEDDEAALHHAAQSTDSQSVHVWREDVLISSFSVIS